MSDVNVALVISLSISIAFTPLKWALVQYFIINLSVCA